MIYAIVLDTSGPGGSAGAVGDWIRRNFGDFIHPSPSCWVVAGPLVADQLHTALPLLIGPAERLVIVKAASEAMWHGIDEDEARWLAAHFPGSLSERIPGETEGLASQPRAPANGRFRCAPAFLSRETSNEGVEPCMPD